MKAGSSKILCVEDDRDTAALIAEDLGDRGYDVRLAHDGREGLEAMLRELPRPIIGRVADQALWLDMRCLEIADEAEFTAQWSAFGR